MTDQKPTAPDDGARQLHELLTRPEVARLLHVETRTVSRWVASGQLPSVRTASGQRRFLAADVEKILLGEPLTD